MDDHKNPDGTHDGIGVMSALTGLPRAEVQDLAQRVRANGDRLESCAYHEFVQTKDTMWAKTPSKWRYVCKRCGGEIGHHEYVWHQKGRRAKPQS